MMEIEHMDRVKCYAVLNYGQVLCRMGLSGFTCSSRFHQSQNYFIEWEEFIEGQHNIRKHPYWFTINYDWEH